MSRFLVPVPGRWALVAFILATTACGVSLSAENEMGDEHAAAIVSRLRLLDDSASVAYLTNVGQRLTRVADQASRDWHFYLVDDSTVNAFAVPGGHIFVNRGLVRRAGTYAELAGVIGHEVAHVTLRHSVDQLTARAKANVVRTLFCSVVSVCGSAVAQVALDVGGQALFARYSRDDEGEADSAAVGYLVAAGIDPRGIPSMFERFAAERGRQATALDAWFSSHPMEEARVARSTALIQAYDRRRLDSLVVDDDGFPAFRSAVAALRGAD